MSGDPTLQAVETEAPEESGPDPAARVVGWRIEQLIAVGFGRAAMPDALERLERFIDTRS